MRSVLVEQKNEGSTRSLKMRTVEVEEKLPKLNVTKGEMRAYEKVAVSMDEGGVLQAPSLLSYLHIIIQWRHYGINNQ